MEIDAIQTGGLDREAVLALSRRSNGRPLMQLVLHLSLLSAAAFLVSLARGSAVLAPAIVLEGVVLAFLFAPLHETIHRTAFSSRRSGARHTETGDARLLPLACERASLLVERNSREPDACAGCPRR